MSVRNFRFITQCISVICLTLVHCTAIFGQGKFIPNLGQWDSEIASRAEVSGGALYLCKDQIRYNFLDSRDIEVLHANPYYRDTFAVHGQAFFLEWQQANANVEISSQNAYPEYYNYFIGKDPSHWKSGVHAFSNVNYKNLYPGIDLGIDGEGTALKYTYTVAPGTNSNLIKMKISGAEGVFIKDGDLHIYSQLAEIVEKNPYSYQFVGDQKVQVVCNFKLINGNILSFDFPNGYDKTKTLVIDPVVIFATYSGSKGDNFGFTATYDNFGNGYSGGDVYGAGFPVTAGAYQQKWAGGTNSNTNYIDYQVYGYSERDVGILKYTPDGKSLIYATYLGGVNGNEQPHSMVIDKTGNLVVIGTTASNDFPVLANAYQYKLAGGTDIFVSKFSPDGTKLLASTYIGGSYFDGLNGIDTTHGGTLPFAQTKLCYNYGDQFRGDVTTDKANNVYVASSTLSSNFPTTAGSFQPKFGGGRQDGCVFKLDSNFQKLIWSTYLGGNQDDGAYSLQLDSQNNIFVAGGTLSPYFFPKQGGSQEVLAGDVDGYICHIKNDGKSIINSTYLGTISYDQTYFVQLDKSENVYVYGQTGSWSFPVVNVKYSVPKSGNFITKFNNELNSIVYSTVFGSGKGVPDISPTAFLVDKCEKVYISGWGGKLFYPSLSKLHKVLKMPITPDAFQKTTVDSSDFYVSVFEKGLDTLLYASYFGGPKSQEHVDGGTSRFDKNGIMYQSVCGGCGGHSDFPTTPGAWSRTNNSPNCNNLLFKVDLLIPTLKAGFIAPQFGCLNVTLSFSNTSTKAKSFIWDFGDGSPKSNAQTPQHFYTVPGNYQVTLVAINPNSCEVYDTFRSTVTIYKEAKANYATIKDACGLTVEFEQTGESNTTSWDFGDGTHSSSYNAKHIYNKPGVYKVKLLVDSGTTCVDSFSQVISLTGIRANFSYDYKICTPQIIQFTNLSAGTKLKSRKWYFPFVISDTSLNPTFDFTKSGTFLVSLVVTDSAGCKDSFTKTIVINTKPTADFKYVKDSCSLKATFKNLSTSTKAIHWDFGDGATSNADSVVHVFPKDSTYIITIISDSGAPCADTFKKSIVFSRPKSSFGYSIDTCLGIVTFKNKSTGATSYNWKFTDKDASSLQNPTFTFNYKGHYPVTLAAKSINGCTDSFTFVLPIDKDAGKRAKIPNIFTPNGDVYNNKFVIDSLSSCFSYELWIYNRWGQIMYHQVGNTLAWDGYYNHKLVPEGAYYWVFHGELEGMLEGAVTVIY